ncbi:MAG: hypothetical protein AAGA77_04570 [Bacteroidota bacterium]
MLRFQKTNFFKGICVFLVLAIFNLSCQSSYQASDCEPFATPIAYQSFEELQENVHFALDVASTMNRLDGYTSINDAYAGLFEPSDVTDQLAKDMNSEYVLSNQIGIDDYLDSKVATEDLSEDLAEEIKHLLSNLESIPAENQSVAFIFDFLESQKNNPLLCPSDSQYFNAYIDTLISLLSYHFLIGTDALQSKINSEVRGCNWFQKLVCLAVAATIFSFVLSQVVDKTIYPIILSADKVTHNDKELNEDQKENFALLLSLAAAYLVAFHAYDFCCPGDGVPEQECNEPTGSVLYSTNCDDHRYIIVGPSEYASTQWDNDNTDPNSVVTIRPELNFNVPSLGDSSIIRAIVSCIANADEVDLYDWADALLVDYIPLPTSLAWAYTPPNTAQIGASYEIAVTNGTTENLQLAWSVTPQGGAVTSIGPFSGKLTFFTSGSKVVKATLTDICTGESKSVSKTVNVN